MGGLPSLFRRLPLLFALLAVAAFAIACSANGDDDDASDDALTEESGPSLFRPGNRFSGWGGEHDRYLDEIQPILGKRCVTCHGCSQSPCQLKLTSFEGVMRGATKTNLFAQSVMSLASGPTRLKDGVTESDWRKKGFFSVTEGGADSIMHRLLEHAATYNQENFDVTPAYEVYKDHAENLQYSCVQTKEELESRLAKPGTGMPFGFSALDEAEYKTLAQWIEDGAPGPSEEAQRILETPRDATVVQAWEDFFNQDSPKARLSMRFIFEHVYFGKIHFDESPNAKGDYFELVRATSKTGPIQEIVTPRVNDDPGRPFFYRLKKHTQLITLKDFTVFHLTDAVRARWKQLFLDSDWDSGVVPDYASQNPFKYFENIPGTIRYRFMLENSQRLIDAMVKGDVCTGSSATYAIRDRFFTLFLKPESDPSALDPKFGQWTWFHLDPNSSSTIRDADFERLFEDGIRKLHPNGLTLQDLWDGEKKDKNAWVTVFRHGSNASAHQGPMGQFPETMWVLNYANFERLYYDLVVLYEPWAALPHKLSTWSTMSHVRVNGEDTFVLFLPEAVRDTIRKQFTPGWGGSTENTMRGDGYPTGTPDLDTQHPLEDFVSRVRKYLGEALVGTDTLNPDPTAAPPAAPAAIRSPADIEAALYQLTTKRGGFSDELPDITWVEIDDGDKAYVYTILANRIYWSNSRLVGNFFPTVNRRPDLDSLSVLRGQVGAFPQLFLRVPLAELGTAIRAGMGSSQDRMAVRAKYEMRRNTKAFWSFLDTAHRRALAQNPLEAGIIDTSAYVWPASLVSASKDPLTSQ